MRKLEKKTELMLEVEKRYNLPIEEIIRRLRVDEGKSIVEIKEELGITYETALKWKNKTGVYSRKLNI